MTPHTISISEGDLLGGERGAMFCGTDHDHDGPEYVQQRDCHRYKLWRVWDAGVQPVLFVMLNPSTADENKLDPTLRRCRNYAMKWGYGGFYIGNLYGYRTKDPDVMKEHPNPVGEQNMEALAEMAALAGLIVLGWGNDGSHVPGHPEQVLALLREYAPVHALKLTQSGSPCHPLRLRGDLKPMVYGG